LDVGSRWVSAASTTRQYASLAFGSLIASIPAAILPASSDVTVTSTVADGALVYRLTWKNFVGDSAMPISETLDLAAMGDHFPISETSATATAS
jgi:hypothetical protein